jgi:hypothetical protein
MEKSIKGILIDPFAKTVTEVQVVGKPDSWGTNYLESFYTLLKCRTIEAAPLDIEDESLYVDEEGMFAAGKQMFFYLPKLSPYQPLAGMGVFVGLDNEGDSKDTSIKIEDIQNQIEWLDPYQALQKSKTIEATL